jgi:hypothetical protein
MLSDLWLAARALLRPWWARLLYSAALLVPALCFYISGQRHDTHGIVMVGHMYPFLMLSILTQVCLSDPRARTIPRYRQTHVALVGVLFLLPLMVNSGLLFLVSRSPAEAALAVARVWALSAMLAWLGAFRLVMAFKKLRYIVLLLTVAGICIIPDGTLLESINPALATVVLCALALAAFVGLGALLLCLHDEAYSEIRDWKQAGGNWSLEDLWPRQRPPVTAADMKLHRHFPPGNNWPSLVRRLRGASNVSPWWVIVIGTSTAIVGGTSILLWLAGVHALVNDAELPPAVAVTVFYTACVVLPSLSVVVGLQQWATCAERAALWPVSRPRLCSGVGMSAIQQGLIEWTALVTAVAILIVLWQPALLLEAWVWQTVAWSVASVLFVSGVGAWLLRRCRSKIVLGVLLMPLVYLPMGALFLCAHATQASAALPSGASWLTLALLLAAFGIIAGSTAHRLCTQGDWI